MSWFWPIVIFVLSLTVLIFLAALSRHKKSATHEIELIGSSARVDSPITPEGTVLVQGELWRARSANGTNIAANTIVRVIGISGHLLIVDR